MESASPHTIHETDRSAHTSDFQLSAAPQNAARLGWVSSSQSVPAMISRRANESPAALAIADVSGHVTFAELENRASGLATHLRMLGAQRETLVAIYAPRSLAFSIVALAVMKASAAYLPLDPSIPTARSILHVQDARPDFAIALDSLPLDLKAALPNLLLVNHAGELADSTNAGVFAEPTDPAPQHLAYVIYTSGSSGRPKGVEIEHKSLSNLAAWHCNSFRASPADRVSHLSSVGFDAAVWEVWPNLAAGASVHIANDLIYTDCASLQQWILDNGITLCFAAAPLAEQLMHLRWPVGTPLRLLLTGADTLHSYPPPGLPFAVVNNYGPTECAVVATSGEVPSQTNPQHPPSIGRPISNTRIYLLDENRCPVHSDLAGEIWIAGPGVARGYRGRGDLDESAFCPDPFDPSQGNKMYRTGDLGRFLPSGEIQFLGRSDEQIKIRGFRVEPAEIECALNEHPDVSASGVVACAFDSDDLRLVAHLTLKNDHAPSPGELRSFLSMRLPPYMIPSAFIHLDQLPLTPNGKIDRRALSQSLSGIRLSDAVFDAPRGPLEDRVASLVKQLLPCDRVGRNDNFFLLGGHSLLATQLIVRLRDAFGVDLSLRFIFESPSVASLAAEIERLVRARVGAMTDQEVERHLASGAGFRSHHHGA